MPHDPAHVEAVARAFDAEDAAQRGEPDPWSFDAEDPAETGRWQDERRACATAAIDALRALGWTPPGDGWLPIDSAPKEDASPAKRILLLFADGAVSVAYWDPYYAEGGRGCTDGFAWIEPVSGEPLNLSYDNPTHWRPLPSLPGGGAEP